MTNIRRAASGRFLCLLARLALPAGPLETGLQCGPGVFHERPAERRAGPVSPAAREMETPDPLGTGKLRCRRGIPINMGHAPKLQEVTGLEIDEQQRRARFGGQIAQRVEIAVAAKVG